MPALYLGRKRCLVSSPPPFIMGHQHLRCCSGAVVAPKGQASNHSGMLGCVPCILWCGWSSDSPGVSCSHERQPGHPLRAGDPIRSISYSASFLSQIVKTPPFALRSLCDLKCPGGVLVAESPMPEPSSQGMVSWSAEMEPGTWDKGPAVRTLVVEVVSGVGTGEPPRPHSSLNTGHLCCWENVAGKRQATSDVCMSVKHQILVQCQLVPKRFIC